MNAPRRLAFAMACIFLASGLAGPLGAELEPLAPERRIDGGTGSGDCPALASFADGTYLAVWSVPQGGGSFTCQPDGEVWAQHLARNGRPLGAPLLVGRSGTRCVDRVQAGFPTDAGVTISWHESEGKYGDRFVVAASIAGGAATELVHVPGHAAVHLRTGSLLVFSLADSTGDAGLLAQRYDPAGAAVGAPFQVLPDSRLSEFEPAGFAAAEVARGIVAAVWETDAGTLAGRRFRPSGKAVGAGFEIAAVPVTRPLLRGDGSGRFVVGWSQESLALSDGWAQVFRRDVAVAPPFRVNKRLDGNQEPTAVYLARGGEVVVSWTSERILAEGANVVAREYDATGHGDGPALALQTVADGIQRCAALSEGLGPSDGRWLAAWAGDGIAGRGLYARLLRAR